MHEYLTWPLSDIIVEMKQNSEVTNTSTQCLGTNVRKTELKQ